MPRANLFFKVEIDHDKGDDLERLGAEIARQIMKTYGVQAAELTNYVTSNEE